MKKQMNDASGGIGIRADSWAAKLTEMQQWELYRRAIQPGAFWTQVAQAAVEEYGLAKPPSRSAFYRWLAAMRRAEHEQQLKDAMLARIQSAEIGKNAPTDEELIAHFKSLAAAAATKGDIKGAEALIRTALAIQNGIDKRAKTDLQRQSVNQRQQMVDIAEQRLKMDKRKFKSWIRKEEPPPNSMSDEEVTARMREILGVNPEPHLPVENPESPTDGALETKPDKTKDFLKEYKRRKRIRNRRRSSLNCPVSPSDSESR